MSLRSIPASSATRVASTPSWVARFAPTPFTSAVNGVGANRATQLGVDATLVAELAGIDLKDILMRAQVLRDIETFAMSSEDQERLAIAVLTAVQGYRVELKYDKTRARVKQTDVRKLFDQDRRSVDPRRVSDGQFARLREGIGIDKT